MLYHPFGEFISGEPEAYAELQVLKNKWMKRNWGIRPWTQPLADWQKEDYDFYAAQELRYAQWWDRP